MKILIIIEGLQLLLFLIIGWIAYFEFQEYGSLIVMFLLAVTYLKNTEKGGKG